MNYPKKINDLLEKLINDAKLLIRSGKEADYDTDFVHDKEGLRRWSNDLILFNSIAGDIVKPWKDRLKHNGTVIMISEVEKPLAALETIKYAIGNDLLMKFSELIYAEALSDLFEQGKNLLAQGYFLAAGVIFRAVLEERLRKLCTKNKCTPKKKHATINDLNIALYKCTPSVYNKSMMQNITSLASIGNDAAHNKPSLLEKDVERLENGVLDFLCRYSE